MYFEDVYTSVAYEDKGYTYSQKMFENVDNSISNAVLMGGWASKSPAEKEKLSYFGYTGSMEEALLEDNAYVLADKDTDMEWLVLYYKDNGINVSLTKTDEVAAEFVVWKLTR